MDITMDMIKELKERSGAGIVDCKNVLKETNGNIDEAADILRKKGLSKADKKADRVAKEGLVVHKMSADNKRGLVIKLNCETDFVAKTEKFQSFCSEAADLVFSKNYPFSAELPADLDELRRNTVAKVGENILVSEWAYIDAKGVLFPYIHLAKVGVIADFIFGKDISKDEDTQQFMKNIAMQITAMKPLGVTAEDIPAELVAKEKEIYMEEARATGKPEPVIEKIAEGKLKKFFEEAVLLEQFYILDEEKRIKDLVAEFSKSKGVDVKVASFIRINL